jgi:hypothetical protein
MALAELWLGPAECALYAAESSYVPVISYAGSRHPAGVWD